MENAKEIKIIVPTGFEIDNVNSTPTNIIIKKIEDKKPKSWEEFSELDRIGYATIAGKYVCSRFNTVEEAKAFCALGKLIQLRDAWCGDWRPHWAIKSALAFPTEEMRDEFLKTFKDLIEEAKMFL